MDNHQPNGMNVNPSSIATATATSRSNTTATLNVNGNIAGNNNQENTSSGSSLSSLPRNSLYSGISGGLMTPQMFQNNHSVYSGQNLAQESSASNSISPAPAMLHPYMEYPSNNHRVGTITPSIASSYNSNVTPNMLRQRDQFLSANGSINLSNCNDLKAVAATMQSTAVSGVIVPGAGNCRSISNGKRVFNASKNNGGKSPKRQRRISSVAAATSALAASPGLTTTTTLGGVTIPSIHPQASTALQVQIAAAAAAAEAAPLKPKGGNSHAAAKAKHLSNFNHAEFLMKDDLDGTSELSTEEKAKLNRDRNREHARSTRLRKKAYVNKLKELVEGLHTERTEETKKTRVAVQHLTEVQAVRKSVMRTFLKYLSSYESDDRKWDTLMEDKFWFKQPITPYRSFPRFEIENECRKTRGIEGMITESASMSVMVEGIGSRSARWMHIKRDDFLSRQNNTPSTVMEQNNSMQNAVSSLSSSSGSSNGNGSGNEEDLNQHRKTESSIRSNEKICNKSIEQKLGTTATIEIGEANKVRSRSNGSEYRQDTNNNTSNEYHVYNAPSLPDPMYSGESSAASESTNEINGTDSSSTDEDNKQPAITTSKSKNRDGNDNTNAAPSSSQPPGTTQVSSNDPSNHEVQNRPQRSGLPPNIAKGGGIAHNVRPTTHLKNGQDRLSVSPVTPLPPFMGIGKRDPPTKKGASQESPNTSTPIQASTSASSDPCCKPPLATQLKPTTTSKSNVESASDLSSPGIATDTFSSSAGSMPQVRAYFHVNEDDMLLTDDILMCPFIFRSQDAVLCGALAECIMPGMLRAHFSSRNKLLNLEMVYDAMGFMQQLERASGREGTAQIIPNSLDMALVPIADEPRVITLAKQPFPIISVNEAWTKMTKYTQMDAEGKELKMLYGKETDHNAGVRLKKPRHAFEDVRRGRCACSVNRLYDKNGSEYIEFACSYPLSNSNNEVTHLLHISKELPFPIAPAYDFHDTRSDSMNSREED